jgi:hypothetical protein
MTLKVVGVYSSCTTRDSDKPRPDLIASREIHSGTACNSEASDHIVSDSRSEKLTKLTKQLLEVPITKQEVEYISVVAGGVLNDRHYYQPKLVKRNGIEYMRRRVNEINIFSKEELDFLNQKFGTDVSGGQVGENILVSGRDINQLSLNTILKIGNKAVLRVSARRSFCTKFIGAFYRKDYFTKIDYHNFDVEKIGLATQVIQPGIIKPGDTIEIIEPKNHKTLSLRTAKIKFELYDINDPNQAPIQEIMY